MYARVMHFQVLFILATVVSLLKVNLKELYRNNVGDTQEQSVQLPVINITMDLASPHYFHIEFCRYIIVVDTIVTLHMRVVINS